MRRRLTCGRPFVLCASARPPPGASRGRDRTCPAGYGLLGVWHRFSYGVVIPSQRSQIIINGNPGSTARNIGVAYLYVHGRGPTMEQRHALGPIAICSIHLRRWPRPMPLAFERRCTGLGISVLRRPGCRRAVLVRPTPGNRPHTGTAPGSVTPLCRVADGITAAPTDRRRRRRVYLPATPTIPEFRRYIIFGFSLG